jgi:putative transposase
MRWIVLDYSRLSRMGIGGNGERHGHNARASFNRKYHGICHDRRRAGIRTEKPIAQMKITKTLRLRVKDKHSRLLAKMARDVNQVFNFCNETSMRAIRERHQWLSGYDLQKLTAGFCSCDGVTVSGSTVQSVCAEYAARRQQFKRTRLNWRVSDPKSSKFSLGWVPFKGGRAKYKSGQIVFSGHRFSLWDSYGLAKHELRAGSFSQDSRGRWYFNVAVAVESASSTGTVSVGVDLGLKTSVTTSQGQTFEGRLYRASENRLAIAQRAGKRRQVKAIHAKIKNQRKDGLHKFSTELVAASGAIFVGNVSAEKMVKTRMAKSTLDAGWSMFKTMLEYKCHQAGVVFAEVNEAYSTQTCSQCGSMEGPKGLRGLGIRRWRCSCGVEHDRDVNAAKNIARVGLDSLAEGAVA